MLQAYIRKIITYRFKWFTSSMKRHGFTWLIIPLLPRWKRHVFTWLKIVNIIPRKARSINLLKKTYRIAWCTFSRKKVRAYLIHCTPYLKHHSKPCLFSKFPKFLKTQKKTEIFFFSKLNTRVYLLALF